MSEAYKKLIKTLRTLFEMDKADLDFGIYRILNHKRDEISRFLDEDLLPQVKAAFADYAGGGKAELQVELEQAIAQAKQFGAPDPEQAPAVLAIKAKLASAVDITAVENEVYSHLHTFFSRYYDQGDFISQRRYKADTYAIPYEGEEVKLYWANHDQYYVKSSEHLRDYAFTVHDPDGKTVRIQLVEADTEKDNIKATADHERRFVLDTQQPLHLEGSELQIRFQYVPAGKKKQDALNAEAVAAIFVQSGYDDWLHLLHKPAPTDANPKRTLLEKHLNDYTRRNTFDYFIHKDLGGFLRRELDFYIKSEVLHLDDVDDAAFAVTEAHLRKIRVLRSIAQRLIQMLAQVEDFQKKLWLKRKFVTKTNYCITLDRIPEELHTNIATCEQQWMEWGRLGFLNPNAYKTNTERLAALKNKPHLLVDTVFYDESFRDSLIATFDDLDGQINGLLVQSENYQALNFLSARFQGHVDAVFIDPPYNTGVDGFAYKDRYQHSSWLSLMQDRFRQARALLSADGLFGLTVDFVEVSNARLLCDACFGANNFLADIAWEKRYTRSNNAKKFYSLKDTLICYGASESVKTVKETRSEKSRGNYSNPDNDPRGNWISSSYVNPATKAQRPNLVYKIRNPFSDRDVEHPTHAWKYDKKTHETHVRENRLYWGINGDYELPRLKSFLSESKDFMVPVDVWSYKEAGTNDDGGNTVKGLFGEAVFDNPKPVKLVEKYLQLSVNHKSPLITLDFFSGSGTTGHAVINLARGGALERKYILIEMGEHFESVLKPRLAKAVYADQWDSGQPMEDNDSLTQGISHCFKYLNLESYEDTLNNLRFRIRSKRQQDMLNDNPVLREDYMLGYWLDVETEDSPSLLNIDQFEDPFNYKLNIANGSVGAFKPTVVDLVETFNYLIGLHVKHIDSIRGFKVVMGKNPQDESVLVIWRKVKEQDNAALEAFMEKQGYNPRDTEFDRIYVNGDHTLEDPHSKVKMTEIEFKRLMFDVQDV